MAATTRETDYTASRIVITHLGRNLYDASVWILHREDAGDERLAESNTFQSRGRAASWAETTHPGVAVQWR